MLVQRAYRFRIYPTRAQATLLAKTFGCKRFVWNAMLAERVDYYREQGAPSNHSILGLKLKSIIVDDKGGAFIDGARIVD
jgi:transposase